MKDSIIQQEKEGADFLKEELESAKNEVMHMKEVCFISKFGYWYGLGGEVCLL